MNEKVKQIIEILENEHRFNVVKSRVKQIEALSFDDARKVSEILTDKNNKLVEQMAYLEKTITEKQKELETVKESNAIEDIDKETSLELHIQRAKLKLKEKANELEKSEKINNNIESVFEAVREKMAVLHGERLKSQYQLELTRLTPLIDSLFTCLSYQAGQVYANQIIENMKINPKNISLDFEAIESKLK